MKAYLWIPLALLAGLVIGGWGPRVELKKVRRDLESHKRLLKDRKAGHGGSNVSGVTGLLGINSAGGDSKAGNAAGRSGAGDVSVTNGVAGHVHGIGPHGRPHGKPRVAGSGSGAGPGPAENEDGDREETLEERKEKMMKDIEVAAEAWRARCEIARSTFISNAGLSDQEVKQFDVLVGAMNMRLEDSISKWAEKMKQKDAIGQEDGVRLMSDVTGAMVLTYNEMDRTMSPGWRQQAGGDVKMTDFIDPSVAMPLVEIGDKLDRMDFGDGGPNP